MKATKYTGPNRLKPGEKFLACVWGPGSYHISKRKGFKTIEGARRFAAKRLEEDGIHEVSILVKDKKNKAWPWQVIERHKNEQRERIRQAAKRAAQDRKARK